MAPEPSATVRNTADGEEAHHGARRRHENSGFGAKTGLPIHAPMSRESCAKGIGFYERAFALDPRSVEAQSWLAAALAGRFALLRVY